MTPTTPLQIYGKTFSGSAPENYERFFVPAIGGPLATDLVHAAALRPGEQVLDVACGTGIVARLAAAQVGPTGSVAGVDMTAGMLTVARTAATAPIPIRWYETTAEAMPLPDDAFDVVFCQLGLQFVADKAAALREMRRVLVPGGRIYVSVPTPTRFFNVLENALARHVPDAAPFVRRVFSLNDPTVLETLFRDAGFKDVVIHSISKQLRLPSPQEFVWQYLSCTPLAGAMLDLDPAVRTALEHDVVEGWREWVQDGGLTYSQSILLANAGRMD
jgi:ubiquinone/menaquinone biosynthesis C-methylase UbiE